MKASPDPKRRGVLMPDEIVPPPENDDTDLAELGDYIEQLSDYEERLAQGEIQWQ
jgi:hypothetical protein